jgi:hypothetical protein
MSTKNILVVDHGTNAEKEYGVIGIATHMTYKDGSIVDVGDVVEVTKGDYSTGLKFVIRSGVKTCDIGVMGLVSSNFTNGSSGEWEMVLVKKFNNVKNNETHGCITAVVVTKQKKGANMKKKNTKSDKPYVGGEGFDIGGLTIKDVKFIKSASVTVMEFTDGSKVKFRAHDGDTFDPTSGIRFCIAKQVVKKAGWSGNQFDRMVEWYATAEERNVALKQKTKEEAKKKNIKKCKRQDRQDRELERKAKIIAKGMKKAGITVSLDKVAQAVENK